MKKLLAIIVTVLCMAMLFTGCAGAAKNAQPNNAASNETEAADKQLIFVNPKSIGYAYWDNAKRGAENAGKDVGTEIVFNGNTDVDSAKQINMIEDMITRGATGLLVAPNDAQAVASVFSKAREKGINVVTFDSDAPDTERQYYVAAATDEALAERLIDIIAEEIGGKGQIAFMVAGLGAENQTIRTSRSWPQSLVTMKCRFHLQMHKI